MTMTTKHSPLPWKRSGHQIIDANGNLVVDFAIGLGWLADADDVIRAVNSHADLLAACKYALAFIESPTPTKSGIGIEAIQGIGHTPTETKKRCT